jgi:hypothetical protein
MPGSTVELPTTLQMLLGLYAYLLPMLLYVLWSTLALWDLGRRPALRPAAVWSWALAVFLLPFIGSLVYLLFGGGQLTGSPRLVAIGGGAAIYVIVLLAGVAAGGIT